MHGERQIKSIFPSVCPQKKTQELHNGFLRNFYTGEFYGTLSSALNSYLAGTVFTITLLEHLHAFLQAFENSHVCCAQAQFPSPFSMHVQVRKIKLYLFNMNFLHQYEVSESAFPVS
jgi:hypothetical protein